jgi:hypothetical protein
VGDGRKTDLGYNAQTLYGNYRDYCEASGVKQPFQLISFSGSLIDLCTDVLEWSGIEKVRTNTGIRIKGLRLRQQPFDEDIPRIDESFAAVQGVKDSVEPSEGSQPLQNKACVGYEGQIEQKASQTNQQTSNPIDRGVETVSEIDQEADVRSCSTEQQETEKKKEADVAFTPTRASIDKGLEPTLRSTRPNTNPAPVASESDYSTFPHRSSDNMQAKRNLANKIKEQLLVAHSKEELTAVKQKHGENQTNWVWRNLLTDAERGKVSAIAQTEQLDLLSSAPGAAQVEESTSGAEVAQAVEVFAAGDKVLHAEFGEGIVGQQIGDMLFCRFGCGKRSPWVWEVRRISNN